ncbi:sulfotransferase family protein [Luteimonas cucumeris]|uniref:Sulfotransferase family protein n=1 Tax=Luteimonas cucumeris TaxID=985012 RepID=A0A562LFE0_9GAMM|nr:sulfotransferase [Luteimonas cucumeris]TWI06327.1 sulfotransferase family protein [Luteimonas cucumeris]
MQETLARHWAEAQGFEAARNTQAAKAVYESILRLDAGQAAAWLRLSVLEGMEGEYRAARLHILNAAKAVRERQAWKTLPFVTMQLLSFDERGAIRDLIINADWSHRDVIGQSAVLSQHLWLIGEYDAALRLIDEANRHVRAHHLLSYSRANALRYCGRIDEATAEYEHCLALAPNYAFAHWSLAYHQKAGPPGSRIDRLRQVKASLPAGSLEYVHLCYALFKELDDVGDVKQAWPELQEGARLMRTMLPYDAVVEQRRLAAWQQFADADFLEGPDETIGKRIPIFIVGMPRTGTTLLERILSNHPEIATAGELNDFGHSVSWETDHFFTSPLRERSLDRLGSADYAAIGKEYLRRTDALANGRRYLIDKNPLNFYNAGLIRKALPQARIVCVLRNPMDTCFSNLKELFSGDAYGYSYDLGDLASHYAGFDKLRAHWERVMPEHVHTVRYEELVTDPAGAVRAVMEFCGVAYTPESIDITRNATPVSTASSSQVRQPIHAGNLDAWTRYAEPLRPLEEKLRAAGCLP